MDEIKQYENLFKGRKILFIMPELSTGGAERVMVTIIKYLDRANYTPSLMLLNRGENLLDLEEIGCKVEVIDFTITSLIVQGDTLRFDRDTSFTLNIH